MQRLHHGRGDSERISCVHVQRQLLKGISSLHRVAARRSRGLQISKLMADPFTKLASLAPVPSPFNALEQLTEIDTAAARRPVRRLPLQRRQLELLAQVLVEGQHQRAPFGRRSESRGRLFLIELQRRRAGDAFPDSIQRHGRFRGLLLRWRKDLRLGRGRRAGNAHEKAERRKYGRLEADQH